MTQTTGLVNVTVALPLSLVTRVAAKGINLDSPSLASLIERGFEATHGMTKGERKAAKKVVAQDVSGSVAPAQEDVTPVVRVKMDPRTAAAKALPPTPRTGRPRTYTLGHLGATILRSALSNLSTNAFTNKGESTLRLTGEDQDTLAGAVQAIWEAHDHLKSQSELGNLMGLQQPVISGLLGRRMNTLSPAVVTALIALTRANGK